jgi:RNA polymerase-binding protein DksA
VAKISVKKPSKKTRALAGKSPAKRTDKSSAASKSAKAHKGQASAGKVVAKKSAPAKAPAKKNAVIVSMSATTAPIRLEPANPKSSKLSKSNAVSIVPKNSKPSRKNDHEVVKSEPVIVPSPVPTDGKPRKNQAGLTPRELEYYRELLLAKRRELVGDMSSMEREALRSAGTNLSNLPLHMADQGTDNYEQEFTLGLVEKDRQLLREINQALAKIQDGTFGLCEGTGKPISKPRLEAQPWARFSIEHARMMERTGMGIRRV